MANYIVDRNTGKISDSDRANLKEGDKIYSGGGVYTVGADGKTTLDSSTKTGDWNNVLAAYNSANKSSGSGNSSSGSDSGYTPGNGTSWETIAKIAGADPSSSPKYTKNGTTYAPGSSYGGQNAGNVVDPYAATSDASRNSELWKQAQNDTFLSDTARKQIQEGLQAANVKLIDSAAQQALQAQQAAQQQKSNAAKAYIKGMNKPVDAQIINGKTYYAGANGLPTELSYGDYVVGADGRVWMKGADNEQGTANNFRNTGKSFEDWWYEDSGLVSAAAQGDDAYQKQIDDLNNQINALQAASEQQIQAATDEEIAKVKADMDTALKQYNNQLDQQAVVKAQAADNLALRNAAAGDVGGIGQKRYSDQQAAYDAQALSIQLEAQNLINTTNQLVAQYRAQGQYQLAQAALEYAQAKYDALMDQAQMAYNYDVLLDSQKQQADETAYNRALQRIKLGLFSQADAEAIGYSPEDAQKLVILAQTNPTAAAGEVSRGGTRGKTSGGTSSGSSDLNSFLASNIRGYGNKYSQIASSLGSYMINQTNNVNADGTNAGKHYNVAQALRNNVKNGDINLAGYAMLMRQIGAPDYEIMDDINYYNATGSFPD